FLEGALNYVEKKFPHRSEEVKKFLEQLKLAANDLFAGNTAGAYFRVFLNSIADYADQARIDLAKMGNSLVSDVSTVFQMNAGRAGDTLGTYAEKGIFGAKGYYVDQKGKGLKDCEKALKDGKGGIYAIMKGGEAGHMVVIKEIKNGKVTFYDPDAKDSLQQLPTSRFSESFQALFLPQGYENGLNAINKKDKTPIWGRGSTSSSKR
ncbi:MAG TPA: hypothetical protein V6C82_10020, partial [Chroococcales cyanobacterium]